MPNWLSNNTVLSTRYFKIRLQKALSKIIGKYWQDLDRFSSSRQISQKENCFEPLCTTINDDDDDDDDDDDIDNDNNINNKFNYLYRAIYT